MNDFLQKGFTTAFIDQTVESDYSLRPEFVSNDYTLGKKVSASIEYELRNCDEFFISVAFITESGLATLKQVLKELEERNVKGRILTTSYLCFTEPKALSSLNSLSNIELRIYDSNEENAKGFHTKGYIFRKGDIYKYIIGSSNLTGSALSINKEWNTKLVSTKDGELIHNVLYEFEELWNDEHTNLYSTEFAKDYTTKYNTVKKQKQIAEQQVEFKLEEYYLEPNEMQTKFIQNFSHLLEEGEKRGLLISSCGSGKTYASAFALRATERKKVLFLVHREQIAKQARDSYKRILGSKYSYGMVSGTFRETNTDYVFATMQTMSKDEILHSFEPSHFDTIVIDEVHRAGAPSYQKIMEYFTPDFYLGMSATPERSDSFDIYDLFDHNIAYEIRLQQALQMNLLCPFHYYGITDLAVDGVTIEDETDFNHLVAEQRVDHIIKQAKFYGYSGNRVRGLVFVNTKEVGRQLSTLFNARGYRTLFLSGDDSQEKRLQAIDRLEQEDYEGGLDYIFSVDIMNEGIDAPKVNQIIMLRPTQSPIIFVQQLGRGLRKADDKEFVVILDFIGNYQNNYMIPIALSGDRSYNKDNMRRFVAEGSRVIPGESSIHFDRIARERIYDSIYKHAKLGKKMLKEQFENLKNRLGRIPTILEFRENNTIDLKKYFDEFDSYYNFLRKYYSEEYKIVLSSYEEKIIQFISNNITNSKRVHECALLTHLIYDEIHTISEYQNLLKNEYKVNSDAQVIKSVLRVMNFSFFVEGEITKYKGINLIISNGNEIKLDPSFKDALYKNPAFYEMVDQLLEFSYLEYKDQFSKTYNGTNFVLFQKYSLQDVCRLLNWNKDEKSTVYGYKLDKNTRTIPVFINYKKEKDAIAYQDRFVSKDRMIALSKKERGVDSADADSIYKRKEEDKDNRIYLFVRKNKNDVGAKEFYFLGEVEAEGQPKPIVMSTGEDAFEIDYKLDVPVRDDIYDFITSEESK